MATKKKPAPKKPAKPAGATGRDVTAALKRIVNEEAPGELITEEAIRANAVICTKLADWAMTKVNWSKVAVVD